MLSSSKSNTGKLPIASAINGQSVSCRHLATAGVMYSDSFFGGAVIAERYGTRGDHRGMGSDPSIGSSSLRNSDVPDWCR